MKEQFTNLSIKVLRKHNNLFRENLLILLNTVGHCLTQWSPPSTSIVCQINSIKIIPKFLYLFSICANLYTQIILYFIRFRYFILYLERRLNKAHLQTSKSKEALLGSSFPLPPNSSTSSSVVKHIVRVWTQFRRYYGFRNFLVLSQQLFPFI